MTTIVSALPVVESYEDLARGLTPMWDKGECLSSDPELFFPLNYMAEKCAKRICAQCEVAKECLDYALTFNVDGIWGGTTHRQRAYIRKRLA